MKNWDLYVISGLYEVSVQKLLLFLWPEYGFRQIFVWKCRLWPNLKRMMPYCGIPYWLNYFKAKRKNWHLSVISGLCELSVEKLFIFLWHAYGFWQIFEWKCRLWPNLKRMKAFCGIPYWPNSFISENENWHLCHLRTLWIKCWKTFSIPMARIWFLTNFCMKM